MSLYHRVARLARWLSDSYRWRNYTVDLGETLAKSIARYGEVVDCSDKRSLYPEHEFEIEDIDVTLTYIDDRGVMAWHTSERNFDPDFVEECFNAYSNGFEWIPLPDKPKSVTDCFAYTPEYLHNKYWVRSDKMAWACMTRTGADLEDPTFHMDFTCGPWQRVKKVRYGVWTLKETEQVAAFDR